MQKESINKINFNQLATEWLLFKKNKDKGVNIFEL